MDSTESENEVAESKRAFASLLERIKGKGSSEPAAEKDDESTKVVTARGTEDGLVLRIDGKASWEAIIGELNEFLGSRRRFLEGGEVSVEWLERLPTPEQSFELEQYLREGYGVEVVSRRRRPAFTTIVDRSAARSRSRSADVVPLEERSEDRSAELQKPSVNEARLSEDLGADHYPAMDRVLRDTIEILEDSGSPAYLRKVSKILGEDLVYEDDANAKVVFGTLRSGQRIETPFSLVVVGDVNPGADVVAGGDIFVLGSLRGTAHAAAYDDEAFDRVIVALQMQPVQLRIGSILSRGNDDAARGSEIARIENRRIVVESFNSRLVAGLRSKRLRNI